MKVVENKARVIVTIQGEGSTELFARMLRAGMNVARFNCSHGTLEEKKRAVEHIREAEKETGIRCALMLDTLGSEIRIGDFKDNLPVHIKEGQSFELFTTYVLGDETKCSCNFWDLCSVVKPRDKIFINYGSLELTVLNVKSRSVVCRAENDAAIGSNKVLSLFGHHREVPCLNFQDTKDITFAIEHGFHIVAASYVSSEENVREIKELPGFEESGMELYAKIMNVEALSQFQSILQASDGIILCRSALQSEIPMRQQATAQKHVIKGCLRGGKPLIISNQILNSMRENPRPTRAEVTDIWNAVYDGATGICLTNVVALKNAPYPVEAIETTVRIIKDAELSIPYREYYRYIRGEEEPGTLALMESLASSAVKTSWDIEAKVIVVLTETGELTKYASKYRPGCPILTITNTESSASRLLPLYSNTTICSGAEGFPDLISIESPNDLVTKVAETCLKCGFVGKEEHIVLLNEVEKQDFHTVQVITA